MRHDCDFDGHGARAYGPAPCLDGQGADLPTGVWLMPAARATQ